MEINANDQLRNFCFTINNYTDDSHKALWSWDQVSYAIFGREVAPTTGTPHLQGYCELKSSKKFSTIKKKIPTAKIAKRAEHATAAHNYVYCSKGGDFEEIGQISNQGKRTDIEIATDLIQSGTPMREVALNNPNTFVKFHRGLEKFQAVIIPPRDRNVAPEVICYWGKTEKGKTRHVYEQIEASPHYAWGPSQGKWFDGYTGQDCVFMDEFRGQLPFGFLLTLIDRYPMRVEFKGGFTQMAATKFVFTSPKHPRDWYDLSGDAHDKIDQLLRRFTKIEEL